jgi:hypothetical protein
MSIEPERNSLAGDANRQARGRTTIEDFVELGFLTGPDLGHLVKVQGLVPVGQWRRRP